MPLDRQAEPALKSDTPCAQELTFNDRRAEEPGVGGRYFFLGIPHPQVGEGSDVPIGFGSVLSDDFDLCFVAEDSPDAENEIVGPVLAALEALTDLVFDVLQGVFVLNAGLDVTDVISGIIGMVQIAPKVDRNHPRNRSLWFAKVLPDGLIEMFEEEAIHRDSLVTAFFEESLGVFCRKKMPGYVRRGTGRGIVGLCPVGSLG